MMASCPDNAVIFRLKIWQRSISI